MRLLSSVDLPRAAAALALAATMGSAAAMPPDQVYAKVAPSVWRVFVFDENGKPFGLGSAVVTAKETVLTNCHVVAKAKRIAINHDNVNMEARLQYADVARDMCQLKVRNLAAPAVELANSDALAVGQRVYALGNPQGLELTLSDGLVSGLRKDRDSKLVLIQTTAPISPGSSGGGLFDEEGRLIGLTTLLVKEAQNLNFAVPINWVRDLPARSEAALREAKQAPPRSDTRPAPPPQGHAASGYADIGDTGKLAGFGPRVRESYEKFLARPLPRAFAISDNGRSYQAWSRVPHDPNDSPDPTVRVITECEKVHQSHCRLYAVDRTVVYRPGSQ
jgi:serine protease Do